MIYIYIFIFIAYIDALNFTKRGSLSIGNPSTILPSNLISPLPELPHDIINTIFDFHANLKHSYNDVLALLQLNKESASRILNSGSIDVYKHIPNAIAQLSKDDNNLGLLRMIYEYPNLVDWKSVYQPSKYIMTCMDFLILFHYMFNILDIYRNIKLDPSTSRILFLKHVLQNLNTIHRLPIQKRIFYEYLFIALLENGMFIPAALIISNPIISNDYKLTGLIFAHMYNQKKIFLEISKTNPLSNIFNHLFHSKIKHAIQKCIADNDADYIAGFLKTTNIYKNDMLPMERYIKYAINTDKMQAFEVLAKYSKSLSANACSDILELIVQKQNSQMMHDFLYYQASRIHPDILNTVFRSLRVFQYTDMKIANEFIKNDYILSKLEIDNLEWFFTEMIFFPVIEPEHQAIFDSKDAMNRISDSVIEAAFTQIQNKIMLKKILSYSGIRERLTPTILLVILPALMKHLDLEEQESKNYILEASRN